MRKAIVRGPGSDGTYTYEMPPQRKYEDQFIPMLKHPRHGPNQCCRVCRSLNIQRGVRILEATITDVANTKELMSRATVEGDQSRGSHIRHGSRRMRTRPSKGAMLLFQLIANSTGGQDGESL